MVALIIIFCYEEGQSPRSLYLDNKQ